MPGARFVRTDLHVHLVPEGQAAPLQPVADYITTAIDRGIEVLGITDHNTATDLRLEVLVRRVEIEVFSRLVPDIRMAFEVGLGIVFPDHVEIISRRRSFRGFAIRTSSASVARSRRPVTQR